MKKEVLNLFAEKLKCLKAPDKEGRFVGFQGSEIDAVVDAISSLFHFSTPLPEEERFQLTWKAVSEAAKSTLSGDAIAAAIHKEEQRYLKRPRKKFVLATSLSVKYPLPLQMTDLSKCRITFSRALPEYFDRKAIIPSAPSYIRKKLPPSYATVQVELEATSPYEAAETALDALDLLRGIWNFFFHYRRVRYSAGTRQPYNYILLGPLHTLHELSGEPALRSCWYNPDYISPYPCKDLTPYWERLQELEHEVRTDLNGHPYRSRVEEAIRLYVRALDYREDWHQSFLRLWSLLEYLTSDDEELVNYKQIIARTLFLFRDKDYHRQLLLHLKDYRNQSIHACWKESSRIQDRINRLKLYVETLLVFHLKNQDGFLSFEEAVRFLGQPTDIEELQKRLRITQSAIQLLSS